MFEKSGKAVFVRLSLRIPGCEPESPPLDGPMADLIYFRALGRPELTCGSTSLPLMRRTRKLALFTVLSLSRSPFQSRDILQAMFWPESDQDHARKSLNTAVHALRRDLGANVILSRGDDEIGVAADLVWCDVRAFDDAIAAGDTKQVIDLYGGDLMDGFFVPGAPGFEHWLDGERERLRRAAHSAAWQLAERAEKAGDLDEAAGWARRAVAVLFDDEPGVRRSISLLDRVGDRMGAIQMYERFAQHLQEEYGAKPAPETRRLIAKILARDEPHGLLDGPRLTPADRQIQLAEPEEATAAPAPTAGRKDREAPTPTPPAAGDQPTPAPSPSGGWPRWGFPRPPPERSARSPLAMLTRFDSRPAARILAAAALVVAAVAGVWFVRELGIDLQATDEPRTMMEPTHEPSARPQIVISQFATLGADSELSFLASAITDALTRQLTEVSAIEVITEEAYARVPVIAARLEVATISVPVFLVRGRVLPSGERIRVSVDLIDVSSGNVLRSASIEQPAAEVFQLVDTVAQQVGALLRTELGREIRLRRWRAGTPSVRAFELLHRAEFDRHRAKLLQRGGSVAVGAAQLARADSLLVLAEAEDPGWIDATVRRAQVASDAAWLFFPPPLHDTARAQDWIERGIAHADRALARDSLHAPALELRGALRYWSSFMASPGEVDAAAILRRAENDLRRAVLSDTERARAWSLLSAIYYARGDFTKAYIAADRAYQADAYLDARDDILVRLALTAHEIANDSIAWHWCSIVTAEGADRPISAHCQLHLLAWGDQRRAPTPLDPWTIIAEVADAHVATSMRPHFEMLAATVLARRGLADSARAVAARAARGYPDDELLLLEAGVRVAFGEPDSAAALLRRYVAVEPARRHGIIKTRRFAVLDSLLESLRPDDR